jgi:hypothetical protein
MDSMENIALEQMGIIERLVAMNKTLISELAQYRVMDAEEKELENLLMRLGGNDVGRSG